MFFFIFFTFFVVGPERAGLVGPERAGLVGPERAGLTNRGERPTKIVTV